MMRRFEHQTCSRAVAGGFTLVETLVVIGIVALLLALVLPALSSVRSSGRNVKCLANLREIGNGAAAFASAHDGYVPLGGLASIAAPPTTRGALAQAVGDPRRQRYAYRRSGGLLSQYPELLQPFPLALVEFLDENATAATDALVEETGVASIFSCPDVPLPPTAISVTGWRTASDDGVTDAPDFWLAAWDYGGNIGVVGFDRNEVAGRARSLISRIEDGSKVALLIGLDRSVHAPNESWYAWWEPVAGPVDQTVTLRDVVDDTGRVTSTATLDPHRHGGRTGILYVDGHAATTPVDPDALEDVVLRTR